MLIIFHIVQHVSSSQPATPNARLSHTLGNTLAIQIFQQRNDIFSGAARIIPELGYRQFLFPIKKYF